MLIADTRFQWGSPPLPDRGWSDDEIQPGWIPVDIGRRGLVIRWMNVGTAAVLHEPFFRESVLRMRGVRSAAELETPLSALVRATCRLPVVKPSGIVVHMTRCGSTLLVNALKTAENVVGLGEADSIDSLFSLAASGSEYWARTCAELLPRVVSIFASYQGGEPGKLVIKCGV